MATWRRVAVGLFPELEPVIRSGSSSPYSLFSELLPRFHRAISVEDGVVLQDVVSFAEWALRQPDNHLRNAAAVSFFEHVFDGPPRHWPSVAEWLSPYVVSEISGLWELMLQPERFDEVQALLRNPTPGRYRSISEVWADPRQPSSTA
jgi:hypothetical protein